MRHISIEKVSKSDKEALVLHIEQESKSHGDRTGCIVWDCALATIGHICFMQQLQPGGIWDVTGKRVIELGTGTGVVGIALALLGAASICMTDMEDALDLTRRNVKRNFPDGGADITVVPLHWHEGWQASHPDLASAPLDWIVGSDLVYGIDASPLASLLLELLSRNPAAQLLLAYEERPLPEHGIDYGGAFFAHLRERGCSLTPVPTAELHPCIQTRPGVSLWRGHLRGKGESAAC